MELDKSKTNFSIERILSAQSGTDDFEIKENPFENYFSPYIHPLAELSAYQATFYKSLKQNEWFRTGNKQVEENSSFIHFCWRSDPSNHPYSPIYQNTLNDGDPCLDGIIKRKGGQIRFTYEQTKNLEIFFAQNKYLTPEDRRQLAFQLRLTDRQVIKRRRRYQNLLNNLIIFLFLIFLAGEDLVSKSSSKVATFDLQEENDR